MDLTSGHVLHLRPEYSAPAVLLRLPQALKQALAAAQRSGQQTAFRCIKSGDSYQATLSVGDTQHHFSGVSVEKQTVLRLSTLDEVSGAVVADIGCKLHQQRALHDSNIGSRIRASANAEKLGRGQTQVLHHRAPPQSGQKAHGNVTPPAVLQQPAGVQPRPKTPPPVFERNNAAAGSSKQQTQSQTQAHATRLPGRSLTPSSSRPSTPPPARQPQQTQQQAPVSQQQQQSRQQPKPMSKEPPKPRSLSGKLQQQQQRRTPPPASIIQQGQQQPATAAAASRGEPSAALPQSATAGDHASSTGQAAPAPASRASLAPTTVPTAVPPPAAAQGKLAGALWSSSAGASTAAQDRGTLGGNSAAASRPRSRGVSPAVGVPAAAAAKQQQARSVMPLISVQPLLQSAKTGDRRSPAPSGSTSQLQQQQQPPQRSRLQQGANTSRHPSAADAAGKQQSAAVPAVAPASARASAAAGQQPLQQQQQQSRKRLAPNNSGAANSDGAAGKAAKMRRLTGTVAPKAIQTSTVGAAAVSQPGLRQAASQPHLHSVRQQAQSQRRASPSLPGVCGHRLSPDGSCSAGASPSQQQQHTKHWFTSSDESGGVCSMDGAAVGASKAATGMATVRPVAASRAAGAKRKREPDTALGGAMPPTQAAVVTAAVATTASTVTTHHSWAAAMQAKRWQSLQQAGKSATNTAASGQTKTAVDPATAKSSWQAALRRSPLHQVPSAAVPALQQQPSRIVPELQAAASGHSLPVEPASHSAAASQQPAAAKAAAALDLGPPGYSAFVDKAPRSWGAISNHQEYVQYTQQYNDLYSMYNTLGRVIDANIRSVRRAHEKMAAQSLGSPAHSEAKQQLQHLLTSRAELTRRHSSALHTIHNELASLKQNMQQWLVVRRAPAAAAVSHGAGVQVHCLPLDAMAKGHQQCVGGKGLMLAAAHNVQPLAVVGV